MRKYLISALFALLPCGVFALSLGRQSEADFQSVGQQGTIQITTHSFTAIPSTSTIDVSRLAITVDIPTGQTGGAHIFFQTDTSAPTVAISSGITISPSDPPLTLSLPYTVRVWARSLAASATSFAFVEWK